jgi:hypothetical protein
MKSSDVREVPVSVMIRFALVAWFMWLCVAPVGWAQSQNVASQRQPAEEQSVANQSAPAGSSAAEANAMVPRLIKFSGTLLDAQGKPIATGPVGVTFALYAEHTGGASLWLETQNVRPDENGYYSVLLGSETATGVPMELFATGEARWLGIQVERQPEQPRVLLVSVPYALKAGDAQTLGGRPASDFALANASSALPTAGAANSAKPDSVPAASASSTSVSKNAAPPSNPSVTGKGVLDHIPMWDTASDIVDSVIFQKSTDIGIGTVTPAATLDVNGKGDIRDTLTLFPKGTDSTLAVSGTAFKIDQTGKVTFVSTQTFPGGGTVTANNSTQALSVTQTGTGAAAVFNVTKSTDTILNGELNGSAVFSVGATGGLYDSQSIYTQGPILNNVFVVSATGAISTSNTDTGNGATAITASQNDSNISDVTFGVNASTASSNGIAVLGTAGPSSVFATQESTTGVWGDAGTQYSVGVQGSANDGIAVAAESDSGTDTIEPTLFAYNGSSAAGALVFQTNSANVKICAIDVFANLACNGSKSAVVPVGNGQKMVALYAVEAPENWFEDYGSEHLENGAATVTLDPTYAQTVNTGMEYHVFLTPSGDCNGLYVTNKTSNSFEVRELKGGHSNIAFDYRIIAKRNGYEQIRLEDKTAMMKAVPARVARLGRKPAAKAPSDGSAPARLP